MSGDATRGGATRGEAAPTALHQRIRSEIEQRILTGEWRPGHRIPFEHELMEHYGCARMTVNKALAGLAETGLVVRRKRAGTFVAEPRLQSVLLEIPDIQADIAARGDTYGLELLSRRIRKPTSTRDEEKLLAGPRGELLVLRCLHRANGRPFALEDRLISLDSVPEARSVDFARESPGTWLLGHVAWTQAEHRITAINADTAVAGRLEITPNDACLALERRTWRGKQHITHVTQIFPGARYDLIARFVPQAAASRSGGRAE